MKRNTVLLHFWEKRSCEVDIQGRNMRIFLLVKIGHLILSLQYNWHLLISWLQWSCLIGLGMHLLRQCNVDSGARSSSAGNVRSTHNIYDCKHLCCILDVLIFFCAGVINWIWRYSRVDCYVSRFEDTVSELRSLKRTRNCFPAKAAWELP